MLGALRALIHLKVNRFGDGVISIRRKQGTELHGQTRVRLTGLIGSSTHDVLTVHPHP
ncbi:hypothetical protein D4764_11G0006000 [Takifugu flavidus]|uniref:Uncharacterized protein n=1 Tax=Takifugu flavidus TaxID=433684 RepID=A0A5C6PHT3_9TELE|nr:hypothetical protein D4764_11G0006000 [Takifugu flavidus]